MRSPTILVACNTFKGSLDAATACEAVARGLRGEVGEAVMIDPCPLSDGGEGLVATLVATRGGTRETAPTTDALGRPIEAAYGVLDGGDTVVVELSAAAGLVQLAAHERDPERTTTHGVGTLILAAYARRPFRRLVLALGGSATVDGGAGLLSALGVRFLDAAGEAIAPGGGGLARLASIDTAGLAPALRSARIEVAVDVTNPLLGPRGAARVYGPQKGASEAAVLRLEAGLGRLAAAIAATTGRQVGEVPGTGSAGGVPAALIGLTEARIVSGFELVAEHVGLGARLAAADWVFTGEGQLDDQSFDGKVTGGLAALCVARGIPLVALVGRLDREGERRLAALGGSAFALVDGPMTLDAARDDAEGLLERAAARVWRLVRAAGVPSL